MKKSMSMSLDEKTIERATARAKDLGMSRSAYISFLINTTEDVITSSKMQPSDVAYRLIEETEK